MEFFELLKIAYSCDRDKLKQLIKKYGYDNIINKTDDYLHQTLIHHSARDNKTETLKMLISEFGANQYILDNCDQSALYMALHNHSYDAIKTLIYEFDALHSSISSS